MMSFPRSIVCFLFYLACIATARTHGAPPDEATPVGPVDGAMKVPTGQIVRPAGRSISYGGRPLDLCLSADGALAFIKNTGGVSVIDTRDWRLTQALSFVEDNGSMHGIAASLDEKTGIQKLYITGSHKHLMEATLGKDGTLAWTRSILLPGPKNEVSHAMGVTIAKDGLRAYVCLSRNNTLGVVDLAAGQLTHEIAVGVCPYAVVLSPDESTAHVTNFGGRQPQAGDATAGSAGTAVAVDAHGVARTGTVSVVDLAAGKTKAEIHVGLHPAQIVRSLDGSHLYIANANSDSVSVVDTKLLKVIETIDIRPDAQLPFGCVANALALSRDGKTLFCANGGNNAVAVISLGLDTKKSELLGFIPTAWFPGGLACDGTSLYIANVKGEGSRQGDADQKQWESKGVRGTVSKVALPGTTELIKYTAQAKADARIPQSLRAMERAAATQPAVPVPARVGEPSTIHHVIYVIKENRTYDQVFGDIGKGNSEPKLCTFGRETTPNHHALAEQFVLLDNYYCNGVLSADGHQWATQGMVTDYQEKNFGGHTRSYDFGTDALCYANCDFIWDSVLLHGLSFRNYGEFDFPEITSKTPTWFDVHRDWKAGKVAFQQSVEVEMLRKFTCPDYPGWNLRIPDQCRMDVFLKEFARYEKTGDFPNFVIVYLPQDHTAGTKQSVPTPRAHVADNDLALGRLVEAVSHSRIWADSCIFVNEDDPQDGYDHVDGHRSICLVISPYARRGALVSRFYNQSSVLHTITRMLGLPPLNQQTAQASTMEDCFNGKPDMTPFNRLPNAIALDERNKPREAMDTESRKLSEAVAQMDFSKPDRIDNDAMNRLLWFSVHETAYPAEFAGGHGKGLAALRLKLNRKVVDDD
jgi:YVTN family beta-propeller protein